MVEELADLLIAVRVRVCRSPRVAMDELVGEERNLAWSDPRAESALDGEDLEGVAGSAEAHRTPRSSGPRRPVPARTPCRRSGPGRRRSARTGRSATSSRSGASQVGSVAVTMARYRAPPVSWPAAPVVGNLASHVHGRLGPWTRPTANWGCRAHLPTKPPTSNAPGMSSTADGRSLDAGIGERDPGCAASTR